MRVRDRMSVSPRFVTPGETVATAQEIMQSSGIRHLPILDEAGHIVGILTWSDIHVLDRVLGIDPEDMPIETFMNRRVETIDADAPLSAAAHRMAELSIGSILVTEHGQLVGLFTASDAVRVLAELLEREPPTAGQR